MTDADTTAFDPEGVDPRADLRWGTIPAALVQQSVNVQANLTVGP